MKDSTKIKSLSDLLTASRQVKLINLVTLYRIAAFPVLLVMIFINQFGIFKWLFVISFVTDIIDGYLARKFKANSVLGAKLDSIGDDLTILAGVVGLWVAKSDFLITELIIFAVPLGLFLLQMVMAIVRYGRRSSFHTYGAKAAAILQGFFLCSMFLFANPVYWLFYTTAVVTTIELIEETLIVVVLRQWKTNVKGLYWVLKEKERVKE